MLAAEPRDQEDALLASVRTLEAPLVALLGPVEPGTAAPDLPLPAHAALGYVATWMRLPPDILATLSR